MNILLFIYYSIDTFHWPIVALCQQEGTSLRDTGFYPAPIVECAVVMVDGPWLPKITINCFTSKINATSTPPGCSIDLDDRGRGLGQLFGQKNDQ